MGNIKAIETRYRGYRMRSRLEAKWAVFFDAMGIQWRYEAEGFIVNGKPYLPDFFMPYQSGANDGRGCGFWVEIKPVPLTPEQVTLLDGLAKGTGHRAYAICGDPWPGEYTVSVFQHYHGGAPKSVPLHDGCSFYEQQRIIDGASYFEFGLWALGAVAFPHAAAYDHTETLGHLKVAFGEARAARWEHGERPGRQPPPDFTMPPKLARPLAERDEYEGLTEDERHNKFVETLNRKRHEQKIACPDCSCAQCAELRKDSP